MALLCQWGGVEHAIDREHLFTLKNQEALLAHACIMAFFHHHLIETIAALHQTHSVHGISFTSRDQAKKHVPFMHEGDFLVTTVPYQALLVATADCLPIVLYDELKGVLGLVHAGWAGTCAGVLTAALASMVACGATVETISITYGPSARVCCYQVQEAVIDCLAAHPTIQALQERDGATYFDMPFFNQQLLTSHHLVPKNQQIIPVCTIDDRRYCSYRRDKTTQRNITLVMMSA